MTDATSRDCDLERVGTLWEELVRAGFDRCVW
jgi:hypothetical protein